MKPDEELTKNQVFRLLAQRAKTRGFKGNTWLFDSWYSSKENLKQLKKLGYQWVTILKRNRKIIINDTIVSLKNLGCQKRCRVFLPAFGFVNILETDDDYVIARSLLKKKRKAIIKLYGYR